MSLLPTIDPFDPYVAETVMVLTILLGYLSVETNRPTLIGIAVGVWMVAFIVLSHRELYA